MAQELPGAMRHFSGFVQRSFPDEDLPVSPAFTGVSQQRHEEMPASQRVPSRECKAQSALLREVGLIQAAAPGTLASIKKAVPLQRFAGLGIATLKNKVGQKAADKDTPVRNTQHPQSLEEPAALAPLGGHVALWVGEEITEERNVETPNTFWEREKDVLSPPASPHTCPTTLGASGRGRFSKVSQGEKASCTSLEIFVFF